MLLKKTICREGKNVNFVALVKCTRVFKDSNCFRSFNQHIKVFEIVQLEGGIFFKLAKSHDQL